MTAQPGWYDDPQDLTQIRFWDGAAWTEQRAPKPELPTPRMSRRDLRAQARATSEPARLSKKDARERLTAAEQTIARYQMRAFDDVDAYRAHVEAEIAAKEREFSITSERERDRLAHERRQALEATEAERQALLLTLQQLRDEVETARRDAESEQARALGDVISTRRQLEAVRAELLSTSDAVELQSVGLFDYEHPAADSTQLATQLEAVRSQIKNAVREKHAVTTTSNFLFNNSAAQGRKFVGDMTKVLLRAYNAEAENAVKATRAGNLQTAQTRLSRAAEQIAKSGAMISLRITDRYHRMRLEELELAARHLQAVQTEKELERERRAELREQKRAEAELQAERDRLDKERSHYLATLAALRSNGDADGAARIQAKLDDVDRAISDVDYRAANVRAGYVYVISNVGAFGRQMVKIGMTRRLEPMDRVNELGDASVPFRFDVHALFFADDAVGVETMLHQTFAAERVNKVNLRREFFYTTPEAVLEVLKDHKVEVVSYTVEAEAPEYRSSLASKGENLATEADGADTAAMPSITRQV